MTTMACCFPLAGEDAPEAVTAAKDKVKAEMLGEHRRLLYVALTRARDRLYVCGFQNSRAPRDDTWYRLAEAAAQKLGKPLTRGDITGHGFGHLDDEPTPQRRAPSRKTLRPARLDSRAPRRAKSSTPRLIRPSDALDVPEPADLSPLARGDRFRRGNVVHALLARLPDIAAGRTRDSGAGLCRRPTASAQALVDETLAVLDDPHSPPPSRRTAGPKSRSWRRCPNSATAPRSMAASTGWR